jgi:hypothetical protein
VFALDEADATKIKGRTEPAFVIDLAWRELFLGSDGILGGLGYAELYHGLGLNLDGLASLRIASDTRLAVRLHQPAQAGHNEYAVLLGFFDGGISQLLQEQRCSFIVELGLLGEMPDELCLGQT